MLILVGKSPISLERSLGEYHDNLGILASPRNPMFAESASREGLPWAADNDCFNGGLDVSAYRKMLWKIVRAKGCLFVNAPDAVGDSETTFQLWDEWYWRIAEYGFPVGFVTQDGMTVEDIPWVQADAIFVGGTDGWKLSQPSREVADECRRLGKWLHIGRVNTRGRMEVAIEWGADSVDGTRTSLLTDQVLPWQLEMASFT